MSSLRSSKSSHFQSDCRWSRHSSKANSLLAPALDASVNFADPNHIGSIQASQSDKYHINFLSNVDLNVELISNLSHRFSSFATMTALSIIEHNAIEAASPREVLTARLGAEEYGIDILAVQEIRRYETPTRIANAPMHMLGVMNLRGVIVPIVDLRHLLRLQAENTTNTVTVVVNVAGRTLGLVVDAVSDVMALAPEQIQPRPSFGDQVNADFIVGLAQVSTAETQRLLLLMDLSALLRDL